MDRNKQKTKRRGRRRTGIRKRVAGTPDCPRLCVYRSLNHTYAQVVNDLAGTTIAAASTREAALGLSATGNAAAAKAVGEAVAKRAQGAGVKKVAFDRGGFRYHGRVKVLADAAREAGLEF